MIGICKYSESIYSYVKKELPFKSMKEVVEEMSHLNLKTTCPIVIAYLIKQLGRFAITELTLPAYTPVERTRPNENGEVFNTAQELSYNPKPSGKYKRCTLPNGVVYYGTIPVEEIPTVRLTAVVETTEILEKSYSEVYEESMTGIRTITNYPLRCAAIIGKKEFQSHNKELVKIVGTLTEFVENHPIKEDVETTFMINEFLGNEFGKKVEKDSEYEYKISAAFSDFVFSQGFDAIIYPSVKLGGAGLNIAIRKEVIDASALNPIYAVQMKNYSKGKGFVSDNPYTGEIIDGKIQWKDSPYSAYAGKANCLKLLED